MGKQFQKGKITTISAGHFFHDAYSAFLAPMLPFLIEKLGISLSMAGLLDVIRKIPTLMNPVAGLIADKICMKYFVILTPAVTAITMSLLGLAPTYGILAILLFVMGMSSMFFHLASPVMIKNFAGDRVSTAMGQFMFGGEFARTMGPLLITAAISYWGFEGSYRVMPLGILASVLLFIKLKNIAPQKRALDGAKRKGVRETVKGLVPVFTGIAGFLIFQSGMKAAVTLFLPTFLISRGETIWTANISLAVIQLAGAAGTFGAGYVSSRINQRNTMLISAVLSPLIFVAFIYANNLLILPLLLLLGFVLFASGPILLAIVQETNTERPAFVNGLYMTLGFGISSLMVLMIGSLGDFYGLMYTYKITAVLAILSIPFVFMLPKK